MTERTKSRETRTAEGHVELPVAPERVWRALTEAEELERWFPLEAKVEPGPGGRVWMSWGGEYGTWSEIRTWDPPHRLEITWRFGDEPLQITDYRLEGRDGGTSLRVVTSGIPADAAWDDLVEGTRLGWKFELLQLRHYLERHDGRDRRAWYVRRRVSLPRAEIWSRLMDEADTGPVLGLPLEQALDRTPGWQVAGVLREPSDGLARVTVDPTHDGSTHLDVAVWLAGWGGGEDTLAELARRCSTELARRFPDGRTIEATR